MITPSEVLYYIGYINDIIRKHEDSTIIEKCFKSILKLCEIV